MQWPYPVDFINREKELVALDDLWQQTGAQLLVVYGRRRTDKTTWLTHFGQSRRMVYWTGTHFCKNWVLLSDFCLFHRPVKQTEVFIMLACLKLRLIESAWAMIS
ncbi:MAG: hypothetical protein AAF633_15570, partial [Chloroflexota bacterium]